MKKLFISVLILGFIVLFGMSSAQANSFNDTTIFWPTWGNGTADDTDDEIGAPGIPDIFAGGLTVNNGFIRSIFFNYNNATPLVDAGDVFFDTDAGDFGFPPDSSLLDIDTVNDSR